MTKLKKKSNTSTKVYMVESGGITQELNWIDIIDLKAGITEAQYQEKVTEALATCLQKGEATFSNLTWSV